MLCYCTSVEFARAKKYIADLTSVKKYLEELEKDKLATKNFKKQLKQSKKMAGTMTAASDAPKNSQLDVGAGPDGDENEQPKQPQEKQTRQQQPIVTGVHSMVCFI